MESDARIECAADVPLPFDELAQRDVIGVRRVLLEAERRRDEIDAHRQRLAQRQHHGRCFGSRQAGQLVDGELA